MDLDDEGEGCIKADGSRQCGHRDTEVFFHYRFLEAVTLSSTPASSAMTTLKDTRANVINQCVFISSVGPILRVEQYGEMDS